MKHNDGIDNVEDEQNEQDKSFEFQESKIDKFTVEKNWDKGKKWEMTGGNSPLRVC